MREYIDQNEPIRSRAIHCASYIQESRINLQMHNDTLSIRDGIITTSNSATQTIFCTRIG